MPEQSRQGEAEGHTESGEEEGTEGMKYRTIYADPPWMETGGGRIKRGADRHYSLMKTKDIAALQGVTGFYAPKTEHSRKPREMREMIELVSYPPRIELFARERVEGWDCWGNEV